MNDFVRSLLRIQFPPPKYPPSSSYTTHDTCMLVEHRAALRSELRATSKARRNYLSSWVFSVWLDKPRPLVPITSLHIFCARLARSIRVYTYTINRLIWKDKCLYYGSLAEDAHTASLQNNSMELSRIVKRLTVHPPQRPPQKNGLSS